MRRIDHLDLPRLSYSSNERPSLKALDDIVGEVARAHPLSPAASAWAAAFWAIAYAAITWALVALLAVPPVVAAVGAAFLLHQWSAEIRGYRIERRMILVTNLLVETTNYQVTAVEKAAVALGEVSRSDGSGAV
jgi:hypothetical protein